VVTHDISGSGFSFIFNQYVAPGTLARARFHALAEEPRVSGVVRNCVHVHGKHYRVGIQFTQR